ncbi:MAG: hypothetical protein LBR89_00905, partial [Holosporales bacterium]|nr:hypothetical protein [Holosporales bacterium]
MRKVARVSCLFCAFFAIALLHTTEGFGAEDRIRATLEAIPIGRCDIPSRNVADITVAYIRNLGLNIEDIARDANHIRSVAAVAVRVDLERQVNELTTRQIPELQEQQRAKEAELADLRGERDDLQVQLTERQRELTERQRALANTNAALTALRDEHNVLGVERDALQGQRDALQGQCDTLQGDVEANRRQIAEKDAELAEGRDELTRCQDELDALNDQLDALHDQLAERQRQLADNDATIDDLRQQLTYLQARNKTLTVNESVHTVNCY